MKAEFWQVITLVSIVLAVPLLLDAQRPASTHENKTFSAFDSTFRFTYPSEFQVCAQGQVELCSHSYIPVCDQDALVCVVYSPKQFAATNFGEASFQVKEIVHQGNYLGPVTPNMCVTPYPRKGGHDRVVDQPEFLISADHPVEVIGGIQFLHGVTGGAAMNHSISVDLYRASHNGRCFELSISGTAANPNVAEQPMKTLTATQRKRLNNELSQILHSFRFSK